MDVRVRVRVGVSLWFVHTNANDIELKATLQQLLLNLVGDAIEADVAFGEDTLHLRAHRRCHCRCCCPLLLVSCMFRRYRIETNE